MASKQRILDFMKSFGQSKFLVTLTITQTKVAMGYGGSTPHKTLKSGMVGDRRTTPLKEDIAEKNTLSFGNCQNYATPQVAI